MEIGGYDHILGLKGTPQRRDLTLRYMLYRNQAMKESWDRLGADPENQESMVYIILSSGSDEEDNGITIVTNTDEKGETFRMGLELATNLEANWGITQ